MAYIDRVRECSVYDPSKYVPFMVGDVCVGQIETETVAYLREHTDVFWVSDAAVHLQPDLDGFDDRTAAFAHVTATLRDDGLIPGWRDEPYPVGGAFNLPPLFEMERASVPLFGVRGYGVHMNGWLSRGADTLMWVGRRSLSKPTGPGKLDQMVAGGQPSGMALMENVVKECREEAGIDTELAGAARSVGAISYLVDREEGLRQDVLFTYDLEVPPGVMPVNEDGEVAEFMLWPMEKVIEEVSREGVFKFNSGLVVIDFLIRHGFVDPETPGYTEIASGLHR